MSADTPEQLYTEREWAQTEIGRLFYAYEQTRGMAWAIDTELGWLNESSSSASKRAKAAWAKADTARAAFLTALRGFP